MKQKITQATYNLVKAHRIDGMSINDLSKKMEVKPNTIKAVLYSSSFEQYRDRKKSYKKAPVGVDTTLKPISEPDGLYSLVVLATIIGVVIGFLFFSFNK